MHLCSISIMVPSHFAEKRGGIHFFSKKKRSSFLKKEEKQRSFKKIKKQQPMTALLSFLILFCVFLYFRITSQIFALIFLNFCKREKLKWNPLVCSALSFILSFVSLMFLLCDIIFIADSNLLQNIGLSCDEFMKIYAAEFEIVFCLKQKC